jgi:hypothetical protein
LFFNSKYSFRNAAQPKSALNAEEFRVGTQRQQHVLGMLHFMRIAAGFMPKSR